LPALLERQAETELSGYVADSERECYRGWAKRALVAQRDGAEIRDRITAKLPLDGSAANRELELLADGCRS